MSGVNTDWGTRSSVATTGAVGVDVWGRGNANSHRMIEPRCHPPHRRQRAASNALQCQHEMDLDEGERRVKWKEERGRTNEEEGRLQGGAK